VALVDDKIQDVSSRSANIHDEYLKVKEGISAL
jgi:hypothetical protein